MRCTASGIKGNVLLAVVCASTPPVPQIEIERERRTLFGVTGFDAAEANRPNSVPPTNRLVPGRVPLAMGTAALYGRFVGGGTLERPRREPGAATLLLWWVALTIAFAVVALAVMFRI